MKYLLTINFNNNIFFISDHILDKIQLTLNFKDLAGLLFLVKVEHLLAHDLGGCGAGQP